MINVNTANGATLSREYYHHDRLGSVRAMVSETGSVLAYYVYTPFGVEDYGASGNPFRFTGQRYDAAIRLYYYRARYYDPELGRFLQIDPVLYEDQMNLYAYVGNSPLMATDPSGMCTRDGDTYDCVDLESFPESERAMVAELVNNVGTMIEVFGTEDQKATWEAIETITYDGGDNPAGGGLSRMELVGDSAAITVEIGLWQISDNQDRKQEQFMITAVHEVEHWTIQGRLDSARTMGFVNRAAITRRDEDVAAYRQAWVNQENGAEQRSVEFLTRVGLIGDRPLVYRFDSSDAPELPF